ncbi:hypothetical protein JOD82_001989 [Paenibacillus sp. 1182]|uniref:hypothetical protein n=1 Tax=Paenibacillus sp. 1182 TaxID=2806565 RepID=UPI001AEA2136|nr:hypothetical protein [Paenibacillus sp. 1182]MBP1308969.1 hypothetical protein [Paenibacillus sp. 1182]
MTSRRDWEKAGKKNACRICGQFIENDEEYYLVVVPFPYAKQHSNFLVHAHEWETFSEGITDIAVLFEKLSNTEKPNTINHTVPDAEKVEAFRRALRKKGGVTLKETANRIYFTFSNKSSFYFEKRFGYIENMKKNSDIMDRMFTLDYTTRLYEEWKKELRETVEEGFRVEKFFEKTKNILNYD